MLLIDYLQPSHSFRSRGFFLFHTLLLLTCLLLITKVAEHFRSSSMDFFWLVFSLFDLGGPFLLALLALWSYNCVDNVNALVTTVWRGIVWANIVCVFRQFSNLSFIFVLFLLLIWFLTEVTRESSLRIIMMLLMTSAVTMNKTTWQSLPNFLPQTCHDIPFNEYGPIIIAIINFAWGQWSLCSTCHTTKKDYINTEETKRGLDVRKGGSTALWSWGDHLDLSLTIIKRDS